MRILNVRIIIWMQLSRYRITHSLKHRALLEYELGMSVSSSTCGWALSRLLSFALGDSRPRFKIAIVTIHDSRDIQRRCDMQR
jgi:hypothetical protein